MYSSAVAAGIASTFLASLEDLRTREVPNYISHGTAILGIFIATAHTMTQWTWSPLLHALYGLIAGDLIGRAFYYTGQWGGGDAKLLRGIGAVIGLDFSGIPLLVLFIFNLFLAGAVFGLVWSIVLAVRDSEEFAKSFADTVSSQPFLSYRTISIAIGALLLVGAYFAPAPMRAPLALLVLVLFGILYLWAFINSVEASSLYEKVAVEDLVPGDWVAEDIQDDGTVVHEKDDLGVSPEKIEQLQELRETVRVKRGLPFVPSFFVAFLATVLFENWLLLLW